MRRNRARVRPRSSATISRESTHSAVSWGSMSGSCWLKPSKITIPVSHPPESDSEPAPTVTGCCDEAVDATEVYTDGACVGNPGPGGWAWAVPGGRFASGAAAATTNQRMEVQAALEAVTSNPGPLVIVSDSTYVVNCFRDRRWEGWLARGWMNKAKKPVANRDLWEPLIQAVRADPARVTFRWVKGHGEDPFNDLVDRLAVEAARTQAGRSGEEPPTALGGPDAPGGGADARRPEGHLVAVVGHKPPELG